MSRASSLVMDLVEPPADISIIWPLLSPVMVTFDVLLLVTVNLMRLGLQNRHGNAIIKKKNQKAVK